MTSPSLTCVAPLLGPSISRVKPSTGEPSVVGVDQVMLACLSPKVAVGAAGWLGLTSGRTMLDGADGSESPTSFVATTVKVYSTLFVRPVIVHVVTWPQSLVPLDQRTVNFVIGAPLFAPAVQATVAVRDSWVSAVTATGGSGRSRTVSRMRPSTCRLTSLVASASV